MKSISVSDVDFNSNLSRWLLLNKKQNDYDERLQYRVGRTKLLIAVISILITVLAYVILEAIPKSGGDDPIYLVEMILWWFPGIILIILIGDGKLGEGQRSASEWSSFMIAQFLKEEDRKKELKENTIEIEQRVNKPKDDNKDDDWSNF
ncbi:MAG: hypothetical protein ACK5IC_11560 [Moheibacter sp.]